MLRPLALAPAGAIVGLALAACGGGASIDSVEEAVRVAADARLSELGPEPGGLRVTGVDCLVTTPIQDDVDQYFCDIRVANESGAGFVARGSEVFYSTTDGTARLLEFPPAFIRR